MPFVICLPAFAVVDLFRLVYPAEIDRMAVIFDLGLAGRPAVGLDVITQGIFSRLHDYRF